MKRNKQLRIRITEEEMAALKANSEPGKRSEFIRKAIWRQIEAIRKHRKITMYKETK